VLEFVDSPEAATALVAKYGTEPPAPTPTPSSAPPVEALPQRSVEERLKELDSLKSKGLVTDEEYKAHREKILDGL
jgi:hypothetical protein